VRLDCYFRIGALEAPPFLVMVPGVFQFSQSFPDCLAHPNNLQPQFLHIQFHNGNYLGVFPLFALAGEHVTLPQFEEAPTIQIRVLTSLFNTDHLPELSQSGKEHYSLKVIVIKGYSVRAQMAAPMKVIADFAIT
jgi:hypothetical protein